MTESSLEVFRFRWTAAAAALALIGAPLLRSYCLTACNAAVVAPVAAQRERASSSAPCHDSDKTTPGKPFSSNPPVPGHGGCCGHTRIVQSALPPAATSAHLLLASNVAAYLAGAGAGCSRGVVFSRFVPRDPAPSRSPAVLRI